MVPMAIPTFGGMIIQVMTVFVVPLFQSMWREWAVTRTDNTQVQIINKEDENGNYTI